MAAAGPVRSMSTLDGAHLVAIVVLPSTLAYGMTMGSAFWLLLLCKSPLNALFAYLYQVMLGLQAALPAGWLAPGRAGF